MSQSTDPQASTGTYAGWWSRVGAAIIDALPNTVLFALFTALFGESSTEDSSFTFQLSGLPFVIYLVLAIGWFVYNVVHLQGTTGQTVGKKMLGIAVYGAGTRQPIGRGMSFARQLVHIVDALPCYLGFLWPLWDKENRTFADMIMGSRVYRA